jgi:glycopeptide antibiotics resistance protein
LPIISAILLWLSLLARWIRFVPFVRQLPNWAQTIASICVALLIAALGVGFAVHKLGLPSGGY